MSNLYIQANNGESIMISPEPEEYLAFRSVLNEDYQDASESELDELFVEVLEELSPAEIENFFSSLKKIGRAAVDIGKKVLPGVVKGAGTGMSVGGPWGALVGGLGGAALKGISLAQKQGKRGGPGQGHGAGHVLPHAGVGQNAGRRLLQLVQSPHLLRVLASLVTGGAGRGSVRGAGMSIPAGGLLNLLGSLANQASAEAHERDATSAVPEYLVDGAGEALGDPDERAELLWQALEADPEFVSGTPSSEISPTEDFLSELEVEAEELEGLHGETVSWRD